MEKNAHPFKQLLVLIGSHLGMLIALELILIVVVVAMVAGGNGDAPSMLSNLDDNMGLLLAMTFVQDILLFVVPVLIVARCFYRDSKREFYHYDLSRSKWLLALAGVATYALLTPFADWLGVWNNQWDFGQMFSFMSEEYSQMIYKIVGKAVNAGFIGLLLMVLAVAVLPAICEELFFRVGLQQLLGKWFRYDHAAVVVTALIFSFVHFDMDGFLIRFVMGMVLGYVFLYSRSLVPNVMLHFVNNAVATVSMYFALRNGKSLDELEQPWMLHWLPTTICTIAAIVLFWYCFVRKTNTIQQQSDDSES
jgi:membrane protease YdiL (CAAX protease family)